jgi:hypothetical protein
MYLKHNDYDVTLETLNILKNKLGSLKEILHKKTCFLGVDGYIDLLYSLCQSRESATDWTRMNNMRAFGDLIKNVAGSSANVERVLKRKISGGFAPNSCKAFNGLGINVILVAALGYPEIHELFKPLKERKSINAISFSNPGETIGLEFDDGKIMLSDFENILNIDWDLLIERIGFEKIFELIEKSDIIGLGHWSLVQNLDEIWAHFQIDIIPSIKNAKDKLFFVDLADIKKRSKEDIIEMLTMLGNINYHIPVMLSLNDQEAYDISNALDNVKTIDPNKEHFEDYIEGGRLINEELKLSYVVIHSPHFATISTRENHYWITQAYTSKAKFTTGGGDHFHSGVAAGLACNLTPPEAILMANALTGIFIRTGNSPDFRELSQFIDRYIDYVEKDIPEFP